MKYCTVCKAKYEDSVSFCPTDGEVLEGDPSSIVGTVLDGQYKIESLLGKGGMGAVYLARHILLGDRVAIKIMPPEVRNNAEWLRRFRREGQAARRFRHANAVTVYDLRTAADGTIYMVMEYVEGKTLDAELKERGRFTPAEALETLAPVMSVLNTAHAMGVVHRDLKPENIMMGKPTEGGESSVKLLDLGIAKLREIAGVESSGTTELTMAGQVLGTPYYMSPEQWGEISRDGNPEVDGRTDIYSLGLVAYEMISGRRPYAAVTLHELRREHINVRPASLAEKFPEVPRGFSDAIDRAIAKDRDDRQATAGEFAAQLRAGLGDGTKQGGAVRTAPDIPYPDSSAAYTQPVAGKLNTHSDVNAATIVTVDAVPTSASPPRPVATPAGPAAGEVRAALPSSAVNELASSVTVLQQPKGPALVSVPQKSRGKTFAFVGAGVLILLLVVVAAGGLLAFNWFKGKPAEKSNGTVAGKTAPVAATPVALGRYWLEVLPNEKVTEPMRVTGTAPLASGQAFKFHLEFAREGYVYIVGPGKENKPSAFLTAKPAAISGLETNQVASGSDFSFPSGVEHWLELDKKAGTEVYTIIFSPQPLAQPAFLGAPATGEPLSDSEQAQLTDFLAKYQSSDAITEVDTKNAELPFVNVKVRPSNDSRNAARPVVFEVRIQHK
ncbi:MAG: eukaryotic-like serine/threonine-protein kinase [Pyrinomonadaceae bacterium]|nr:eukaryotic-like serine/threonine-protein kinase [Pyrinomonadaceae bacterium]